MNFERELISIPVLLGVRAVEAVGLFIYMVIDHDGLMLQNPLSPLPF